MISIKRLKTSRAARNAAASYLAFVSTSLCGLISIPIAVTYLSKAEMGLWTIVFIVVGYLLWLDFGIGNATGRKIADAMAKQDQTEVNRWWTLSIGVLGLLGLLMALVALGICPFIGTWLNIPPDQTSDALWLFLGTAVVSAVGMPIRAYPGLLVAQERFHWVPLVQAMIPWLQLGAFWSLLHAGYGVRAYFPSLMFSQFCGWIIFVWQVHGKGLRIQVDFDGWTRSRFHELFSYSSSLALLGITGAIIQSLPSLLLARLGGLSLVPIYNLSKRGPTMVNTLSQRTTHSFYPNLQKLYVTGEHKRFMKKYREVNQLGIWISLIGAGAVLAGNRSLICWLANAEFYAGHWTNVAFACILITTPFVSGLINLLQYSGTMGKMALIAILELPVACLLLMAGLHFGDLPGLAAAFALLPLLVRGPYACIAGSHHCGFPAWKLCGGAILSLTATLVLVIAAGIWCSTGTMDFAPIEILGRSTTLPTLRELITGALLATFGASQALFRLQRIKAA